MLVGIRRLTGQELDKLFCKLQSEAFLGVDFKENVRGSNMEFCNLNINFSSEIEVT